MTHLTIHQGELLNYTSIQKELICQNYSNHLQFPVEVTILIDVQRKNHRSPTKSTRSVRASETFSQTSRFEDKEPQRRCNS